MKSRIAALFAVGLLAAFDGSASTIVLDDPNQTVVRPTTGSVALDFFGTLTLDPGASVLFCSVHFAFLPDLSDNLGAVIPGTSACSTTGDALRFQVLVSSVDTLGLYNAAVTGGTSEPVPHFTIYLASGEELTAAYSVNVISGSTTVPEPGTLALFSLGLAGLGLSRRRKAH